METKKNGIKIMNMICSFSKSLGVAYILGVCSLVSCVEKEPKVFQSETCISVNFPQVKIYSSEVEDTLRLLIISDTHLWMSDEREDDFRSYSQRMAGAYHTTKHFQTQESTNPEESFVRTLELAEKKKVDAIALLG